ncbi:23S rRNA m(5)U-1939 methyltransferase [Aliiroseovarius halocynthiae]|uniref:Class I SAM-dependent RNA methyltransferase n=1 Tax=Aliiroseovarius halocynthiae TaxID=985055 RepID=A0A545SNL5_9RHOB|nr:class I SAM-dependent RNA methyltransferase [Aliiroseovarius halocynthiae]TQV66572.1 class I SAM-dependent RNA methyltransferase [Aliiroseovarius halocynthiae]SMR82560.1 23S rRNA m(5)U-1939 methyltransferase [Aliiroseovarius halocynthiae]
MSDQTHTITRLGHLGDGIADGPIFAARTLPGEVVRGDVVGDRIEAPKIVTPSSDRVKPVCAHYNSCGGCALMHASDDFVADWKTGIVRNALISHGIETDFRPIHTSPTRSRRRAVLSAKRGKKTPIVGFHGRRSGAITDVSDCHLIDPAILQALPALGELTALGGSRKGELAINATVSDVGLDVSVTGGKPLDPSLQAQLGQAVHRFGFARLSWDGEVIAMETPPTQTFGPAAVTPPPGAFLQATREGEAALLAAVREAVGGSERIVDLFAGCGTFTLPLAENAAVHAVEGVDGMLSVLDTGWRHAQGLRDVTTETRDLFRNPLYAEDLNRFDAAVIDPPRAGAEAQVEQIAASVLSVVAMVSCNAVSFARDAKILLDAGFEMDWIQVVDQFRWSTHTEQVACFRRR